MLSYFRPDGTYRGTMFLFVPGGDEKLHDDGISIVRADGTLFRQKNPYIGENLVEVEGEFSGDWKYSNGRVESLPENQKPKREPSEEAVLREAIRAKLTTEEIDAARARLKSASK